MFVFGDFNDDQKDWLTYSGETDRPGELCYNFLKSIIISNIVNLKWPYSDG